MVTTASLSQSIEIHGDVFVPYITREAIRARVAELAAEINADFEGRAPVLVCMLNGAFMFFSDLVRWLAFDCELDFVRLSSYGAGTESSGLVTLHKDLDRAVEHRDVILVEDIVDTGHTVAFMKRHIAQGRPASVSIVTLLHKPERTVVHNDLEYIGFVIPPRFVIGYGLDYDQKARNLPEIYIQIDGEHAGDPGEKENA